MFVWADIGIGTRVNAMVMLILRKIRPVSAFELERSQYDVGVWGDSL